MTQPATGCNKIGEALGPLPETGAAPDGNEGKNAKVLKESVAKAGKNLVQ
jgi:hypothetical protein